jgi:hypothetical protein
MSVLNCNLRHLRNLRIVLPLSVLRVSAVKLVWDKT